VGVTMLRTKRLQTGPEPRAWAWRQSSERQEADRLQLLQPEAVDGADTGAGKWTADLRNDQGLVKATGGTAVPWGEGQGWARELA
jgi:hypothetical protein